MDNLKGLGLRINPEWPRVDRQLVERFRAIPAAVVGDAAQRLQALGGGFNAYGGRKKFAGPAFTVRVRPGDNLFVHRALDMAKPGDVIVVEAGAALNTAIVGAMMSRYAKTRGIEALVIDGAIRDVDELEAMDFAVVARGATPNGPHKSGPGEIGFPIAVSSLSIAPGDLVMGDRDGVIVVPRDSADALVEIAEARHRAEQVLERDIEAGKWDRTFVEAALRKL
ncbi:RraA family protein [Caenimonas aquaedulcis]|uniref:Putative 4-hydroxy-4-methyl-2-oxoglutarate aldolase n=1 Tax=Caenimonas aquaedulcis TaxID=2793270 RepID=A0A931MJM9_9BURK|nr:RraA family protein [Caenimonas aquaedulcis]MBG9390470.1 RraA family protein [Caenimonas aquaedulcis]